MNQAILFDMRIAQPSIGELVANAKKSITAQIKSGRVLFIGFSGGKDSCTIANLVLTTARDLIEFNPLIVVSTSNTLMENPEIANHYQIELKKMVAYGKKHGINIHAEVVKPRLSSSIQLKVLSGRGNFSFSGTNTDCSIDVKVKPQQAFRNNMFKSLAKQGYGEPVTCLGTRYDESERRRLKMMLRREDDMEPVRNKDGHLILSPICFWRTDDVWEYIGLISSGLVDSYSDMKETMRIYAHSEGTGCSIVASAIQEGSKKRVKGGCGARHGCWICQQAVDKSLRNMIDYDERYHYASGLNKLNTFIRNTRHDWSRRHWIGRTIKGGYIAVQPDTYHPKMLRELFRYMLQLDFDEKQRARETCEEPKFEIISLEMLIAIDAKWSLNGLAKPFSAWADYRDIFQRGIRYDIPDTEPVARTDIPDARFIYVGEEWDDNKPESNWTGLRDPILEALSEGSNCAPKLRETNKGRVIWDIDSEKTFDVNAESAAMIEYFEIDNLLRMHDKGFFPGGITFGYKWYLQYGALQLSHSQRTEDDEILRRTAFKDRLGLTLEYDVDQLTSKSIRFSELPKTARELWSNKATTNSAQTDLLLVA